MAGGERRCGLPRYLAQRPASRSQPHLPPGRAVESGERDWGALPWHWTWLLVRRAAATRTAQACSRRAHGSRSYTAGPLAPSADGQRATPRTHRPDAGAVLHGALSTVGVGGWVRARAVSGGFARRSRLRFVSASLLLCAQHLGTVPSLAGGCSGYGRVRSTWTACW